MDIATLQKALQREKAARKAAEQILEQKSLELYKANEKLITINQNLAQQIEKRVAELHLFSLFPKHNPDSLFRIDLNGKILLKNPSAEKIVSVVYQNKEYSIQAFTKIISKNIDRDADQWIIEGSSSKDYYSFLCCPILEDGIINVYARNITTEKKAEQDAKSNELRLTNLIINLQEGILLEDENRKIILTNELFCKIFSIPVSPENLVGVDCNDSAEQSKGFFKNPETFVANIKKLLTNKIIVNNEELELVDGRFLERDYIPIFIDNIYKGHLWKYRDITQRKQAEVKLRLQEEKYRSIITNMNLGLMEVDLDEKIRYVNQSFCDLCGYTEDELLGKIGSQLFLKGENLDVMKEKNAVRYEGVSDAYEVFVKIKNGEARWWLISGAPLYNDKNELIGSIGIHLDITLQKNLEKDLIDAKKIAEKSLQSKDLFLTNMSHEIRTPMNAIIGMSRQLQKTSLFPEQQKYLTTIKNAADNLLVIINDILDFSKIEAGKIGLENIGCSLTKIVEQALHVIQYKAEEKGLKLTYSIDKNIASVLKGDPFRINQILMNLLYNAVKFTEHGKVDVTCKVLKSDSKSQQIAISISDTGIGMDDNFLKIIFQKFAQEDESIARRYGGTGLGMSICKQLVELMGGSIKVSSKKNEGTVVTIILKMCIGITDDMPSNIHTKADAGILKNKKILLVEDNEMNRLVANTILIEYGATVIEAHNGEEALAYFAKENADLVLMDVRMPIMDGIEATKQIRKSINTSIPIIALTANAVKGEQEKCINAGMNDYLSKPFEEEDLINIIATWLGKDASHLSKSKIKEIFDEPLYDLTKLRTIGRNNEGFIKKMMVVFKREALNAIKEMKEAYPINDIGTIEKTAHRIKPSFENMSIHKLYKEIRLLENASQQQLSTLEINELIEKVETIITKIIEDLNQDETLL